MIEPAHDEGQRHRHRDGTGAASPDLAEGQAQHHGRDEGHEHVASRSACATGSLPMPATVPSRRWRYSQITASMAPVWMAISNTLAISPVKSSSEAGQDQVAGGRDGQELGQALDHPHHGGLEQQHGDPSQRAFGWVRQSGGS
jgi:hypothetical protein